MEVYAIIAVDGQFGYKRGNLSGLISVRGVLKNDFLTAVPQAAA